jgi:cytochrome c oxidase assembly protein subunit 15
MRERLRDRLEISPQRYAQVTLVALAALALIVFTGAGVRLTGSGLGCPDWPKCYGQTVPPLDSHAVIEYGNRLLTGFVGIAVIAASALAFFRRPYRWHLALFGALLPRRPGRQVPPRPRPGDAPLHPLDDAAGRGLRPRLVLAL